MSLGRQHSRSVDIVYVFLSSTKDFFIPVTAVLAVISAVKTECCLVLEKDLTGKPGVVVA